LPSIFDASSLTNLVLSRGGKALDLLRGQYVLDLTLYEIGNALWVMHKTKTRLSLADAKSLMKVATFLTSWMNSVSLSELDPLEVLDISIKEGITFYDAAYLAYAVKRRMALVTDDDSLAKVASRRVKVSSSRDM
jgi:predicted nucleic acid-binding protein